MKAPNMLMPEKAVGSCSAFTLVEILVTLTIVLAMGTFTGPAFRALNGAGTVNKAISDVSLSLELARGYAMANNTYVRVAIANAPASGARRLDGTVLVTLYSADGVVGNDADVADSAKWPMAVRPLVVDFVVNDALNADFPSTSSDIPPSGGGDAAGTVFAPVLRTITGVGGALNFASFIQFSPTGEARVYKDQPSRFIKVALWKPSEAARNAFILRLSGANGNVSILRSEDGV